MRRISFPSLIALGVVAAAATGCNPIDAPIDPVTGVHQLYPEGSEGGAPGTGVSSKSYGLVQVSDCDDVMELLRAHMIAEAIQRSQSAYAAAVQQWEDCDRGQGMALPGMPSNSRAMPSADGGAMAAPAPDEAGESPEHSETNNQVAGVDEADLVKTDGKHIYLIANGVLRIVKSWPATETQELARVDVEGQPKKLFVLGDRLLVYSSVGGGQAYPGYGYYGSGDCTYGYDCVPMGDGQPTKITVLDIADRSAPKVVRELQVSSSMIAARRIGRAVHTVVTLGRSAAQLPHMPTWPESLEVCSATPRVVYDAFRRVLLQNIAALEEIEVSAVLPVLQDKVHQGGQVIENTSPLADCGSFFRTSILDGEQFTSVISLAIDEETPASAATIISPPGVVYSSQDALYLGVRQVPGERWGWYSGYEDEAEVTTIHKFRLDDAGGAARYTASGLVKGRLLNQFAMDEHRGALRLASTTGHVGKGNATSYNTISVLQQQGALLERVGMVDKLAPTEDIRSVRFDGDKGYVVTFKKTDPLFVIDLSQPSRPRVLGELKIPGFSTYMHKMDDTHLLTIGYDADDQGDFAWFTGIQLQIFDVTNPTDPKLKFKHVIGTRGSSSEALTNHLAFTYYAPKDLLALPMTVCEGGDSGGMYGMEMSFSGLMVFDVTAEEGFATKGQVPFPRSEWANCGNWWTDASSEVKRSLIIDDFIYSMSDSLLKVNALTDLANDLVALPLQ